MVVPQAVTVTRRGGKQALRSVAKHKVGWLDVTMYVALLVKRAYAGQHLCMCALHWGRQAWCSEQCDGIDEAGAGVGA